MIAGNGTTTGGGDGFPALETGLYGPRGVWPVPTGGYLLLTHDGCQLWYMDTAGMVRLLLNGARGNTHDGDGQFFYDPSEPKISEGRSVTMDYAGNILICESDWGYVRRIRFQRMPSARMSFPAGQSTVSGPFRASVRTWSCLRYSLLFFFFFFFFFFLSQCRNGAFCFSSPPPPPKKESQPNRVTHIRPRAQALDLREARWQARGHRPATRRDAEGRSGDRCRRSTGRCREAQAGRLASASRSSWAGDDEEFRLSVQDCAREAMAITQISGASVQRRWRPRIPRSATSSGVMSPSSVRMRRNRLRAATIETCCSITMWTSVGNPGRRARIGGRPFAGRAAQRGDGRAARVRARRRRASHAVSIRGWQRLLRDAGVQGSGSAASAAR